MRIINTNPQGSLNAEGAEVSRNTRKDFQVDLDNVESDFSREIIGAAIEVQRELGVGLLESTYCAALAVELTEREVGFSREAVIEASYKGKPLGLAYRADFIVEGSVIVEIKAVELVTPLHRAQLLSYLRVSGLRLGLLINFHGFPVVKNIHRIVNKL